MQNDATNVIGSAQS